DVPQIGADHVVSSDLTVLIVVFKNQVAQAGTRHMGMVGEVFGCPENTDGSVEQVGVERAVGLLLMFRYTGSLIAENHIAAYQGDVSGHAEIDVAALLVAQRTFDTPVIYLADVFRRYQWIVGVERVHDTGNAGFGGIARQ